MATTITKTIKSAAGDYTSVGAWEAGQQGVLTTLDEVHVGEIYDVNPTAAVTIDGSTTDATRYMHLTVNSAYRHAGVWDTGKCNWQVSATNAFLFLEDDYTRVEYQQMKGTHATSGGGVISIGSPNCLVAQCLGWQTAPASGDTAAGVRTGSGVTGLTVRNSIFYSNRHGIFLHGTSTGCVIDNCTLAGNTGSGMKTGAAGANPTVRNTYLHGAVRACDEGGLANVTWTITTSAAADALSSETGLTNSIAHDTTNFTNVTAGSENYHLVSGASATLLSGGTDLSGSFTVDVDGETRSSPWSIGADQIVSSAVSIPMSVGSLAWTGYVPALQIVEPPGNDARIVIRKA